MTVASTSQFDAGKSAFLDAVRASLDDASFLKISLGKYRGGGEEQRCTVARVLLKDVPHLRFVTRRGTQDLTENAGFDDAIDRLGALVGADFLSATLFTANEDVALIYSKKRVGRLTRGKPSQSAAPSTAHNRAKDYLVDPSAPYLALLGVTHVRKPGAAAEIKPSMYAKYRQICRFVEILDQLLASSLVKNKAAPGIVDIGSGKGYLTFALHDHLARRLGKTPITLGVEANASLVEQCNGIAGECRLTGLSFEATKAESHAPAGLDVLIALHACDTATDDAIHLGITGNAALIVCAPCCQHEIAPQIEEHGSPLAGLLKFGLLKQRQADLITDAARALLLEAHGYEVRVIEFVSTEHTAKNLMIAAVRSDKVDRQAARDQLGQLAALTGFKQQRLMDKLGVVSTDKSHVL
jgi:Methyltransferase domain